MRVLLVVNTLPPRDLSGVGEQVVQLAEGLRKRGHEVEVLGRSARGLAASKLFFPLTLLPRLRKTLRRFRPEVVQVHESDGALAAVAIAARRRERHSPTLVGLLQVSYREEIRAVRSLGGVGELTARPTFAERRFRSLRAPMHVLLGRWLARRCDLVLAPSRQTAKELERDYGIRDCGVLPNVSGGLQRRAENVPVDLPPRFVLFAGRLRIRKGIEVLLEALSRLGDEGMKIPLVVAGNGERLASLRGRTERLGLAEQIHFLGRCSPEQVRGLLASAGALVVPSIYEGMPLVILEAMEASLPIVASAVSGIPEVVEDGETGWLVPPEEPEALAEALRQAWSDPDEATRRGEAGRRRLDEFYRPERAARQWEELVEVLRVPSPHSPRGRGPG